MISFTVSFFYRKSFLTIFSRNGLMVFIDDKMINFWLFLCCNETWIISLVVKTNVILLVLLRGMPRSSSPSWNIRRMPQELIFCLVLQACGGWIIAHLFARRSRSCPNVNIFALRNKCAVLLLLWIGSNPCKNYYDGFSSHFSPPTISSPKTICKVITVCLLAFDLQCQSLKSRSFSPLLSIGQSRVAV